MRHVHDHSAKRTRSTHTPALGPYTAASQLAKRRHEALSHPNTPVALPSLSLAAGPCSPTRLAEHSV